MRVNCRDFPTHHSTRLGRFCCGRKHITRNANFTFTLDTLAPLQSAGALGDVFKSRSETDSFATFSVTSMENSGADAFAPTLSLTFAAVSEPAPLGALASLSGLLMLRRRS